MSKRRMFFCTCAEFFFILLFSLGLNFVAEAVEISGSYQGRLDRHAIERELVFAAAHKGAHLDAQGGAVLFFVRSRRGGQF